MFKNFRLVTRSHLCFLFSFALLFAGCGRNSAAPEKVYPAGSTVDVGKLSYSVSNPQWSSSLEGERGPRVPQQRFLVITVSVTNKQSEQASMPLLTLLDASGQSYLELDNGEGLPNWLGLFRNLAPNGSDGGSILFDVPTGKGPYHLRVSSGGDVDKEVTALIEVPDEKASQPSAPLAPSTGQ